MVYTRAEIERCYVMPPDKLVPIETGWKPGVSEGPRHAWILFIAYDQSGHILNHEVRKLDTGEVEELSLRWRLAKGRSK
jgi:hypothetical protein